MTRVLAAIALSFLLSSAQAETIVVDTSEDTVDFTGSQQISDLPGPDGKVSLPEAGLASDNTPGVQTIAFNIPQSDWQYQWLYPGRAVLRPFLGFRVFQPVIIDATTQTAFSGDTNPDGGEVVIWQETYIVDTAGSVIRGFDHSSINVSGGSNNVVQGNTVTNISVYDSSYCLVGGTNPGEGNTGGTIKIDRSSNDTVVGNTVQRVRILGWVGGGQPATNNRVGGPTEAERNFITGYGTWNGEGFPGGTTVQIFDATGTIIENNWIGTTPDGMAQGSLASVVGVGLEGENHNTLIRNNRIAGILGHGMGPHADGYLFGSAIQVYGTGSGVSIFGNSIGLNANDEPFLGSVTGISALDYYLGPVTDVVIGGPEPNQGNIIAGHLINGVGIANPVAGVTISGNSIYGNNSLGIDLMPLGNPIGVTPNDPLDGDTGGNGLQNFPTIALAERSNGNIHATANLDSHANESFHLEFFLNSDCSPSGFGEGEVFIGTITVLTDASGHATTDVSFLISESAPSSALTATATREATGDTSEFSACAPLATTPTVPGDVDGNGTVDMMDIPMFVDVMLGVDAAPQHIAACDLNGSGTADGADTTAFLNAVLAR